MKMTEQYWDPSRVTLWGDQWANADLTGSERLLLLFLLQYASAIERELTFDAADLCKHYNDYTNGDSEPTLLTLRKLSDKGFVMWKTFRHLEQEWHSVTIANKGREVCA